MIDVEYHFRKAATEVSSISEHMDTLRHFGTQCLRIVELGVNEGISTWAWVASKPDRLLCVDKNPKVSIPAVAQACKQRGIDFRLVIADSTGFEIPETDLLFIDTYHSEEQLTLELSRHQSLVRKFILLHDTESFGKIGEDGKRGGLQLALCSFLLENVGRWQLKAHFSHNNGLTVLERI